MPVTTSNVNDYDSTVVGPHPARDVVTDMWDMIKGKAEDYAEYQNVFSNFEFAAEVAGVTVEQVFMVFIGTKVARLMQLSKGDEPNYESEADSRLDLGNYAALWEAYERTRDG